MAKRNHERLLGHQPDSLEMTDAATCRIINRPRAIPTANTIPCASHEADPYHHGEANASAIDSVWMQPAVHVESFRPLGSS
jgi:hypothetical protein